MSGLKHIDYRRWISVVLLGIASFTVVTTELAPIGILSTIAKDLNQNIGTTGLIVTLYAWVGAAAALLSVMMISHRPRRIVLVILMLFLGISNGISAFSDNIEILFIARIAGAVAHGAFWALIGTIGSQLVPINYIGRATAIIFGGVSVASVFGVPLINLISSELGWRMSFAFLGILSVATAITLAISLPHLPGTPRLGKKQFIPVLKNIEIRKVYLLGAFSIVAHFTAFTYIEVLLSSEIGMPSRWVAISLLSFGAAGIIGNFLCGIFMDNHMKKILTIGLMLIAFSLFSLGFLGVKSEGIIFALISGWGVGVAVIFVGIQSWILKLAGDSALPASAIYAAIFNGAVGSGAILGAAILEGAGVEALYKTSSLIMLVSVIFMTFMKLSFLKGPRPELSN